MFQKFWVVLLIALLLGVVPGAYANPPDPTWVGGYWDDDDFDDAVIFIVKAFAVEAPSCSGLEPLWMPIIRIEPLRPRFVQVAHHAAASPRAPPVASLLES